jgi:hypothetical protein
LKDSRQGGLIVRVRSSGAKAFYFSYTRAGRKGSFKTFIGKFPTLGVAAARKQAAILAGQRAAGIDLLQDRREKKQTAIRAANVTTFGELIAKPADGEEDRCPYAVARKAEQIVNWKVELSALRRNLWDYRDVDIRELPRRDIMGAVNRLDATRPGAAADLYKHAYAFLGWAIEVGYRDDHPLAGARRKRTGSRAARLDREEEGRDLSDQEIIAIWNACERLDSFGCLVGFCCFLARGGASRPHSNGRRTSKAIASTSTRARPRRAGCTACREPRCSMRCSKPPRSCAARRAITFFRARSTAGASRALPARLSASRARPV